MWKGVFADGHERGGTFGYRNNVFLRTWKNYERRMVVFNEDVIWKLPPSLLPDERPLVLVTHDESTFNANDGKRRVWVNGKQPIRPKGRGKGIMVPSFLTPGSRLRVPDSVPDSELLKKPNWPTKNDTTGTQSPVRDAMLLLEFSKDNHWTGDKTVDHTIQIAIPTFELAFPGCEALFTFDNASNHCAFAADALTAPRMNRNFDGQQPLLRPG